jgi:hypothetical protein
MNLLPHDISYISLKMAIYHYRRRYIAKDGDILLKIAIGNT